jgi:hypothetical protein
MAFGTRCLPSSRFLDLMRRELELPAELNALGHSPLPAFVASAQDHGSLELPQGRQHCED